eukprot:TRINITY_DN526_c1_g1_i16.p1 TRINITY_DN526_c1_g1~~TRINITY_DN526_c1_g1_i16.p1  ORF type:complete len:254 (+),score=58.98 TRINITY_DN526_c1_g1_i16:196-957(+)
MRAMRDSHPVPLLVHHTPLSVTFAFFSPNAGTGECEIAVVDPSHLEEKCAQGRLTMTMTYQKEVIGIHIVGPLTVSRTQVTKCAYLAAQKAVDAHDMIEKVLEADRKNREMAILTKKGKGLSLSSIVPLDNPEGDGDDMQIEEGDDDNDDVKGNGTRLFPGGLDSTSEQDTSTVPSIASQAQADEFKRLASRLQQEHSSDDSPSDATTTTTTTSAAAESGDGVKVKGKSSKKKGNAAGGDLSVAIKKKGKKKK